MSRLYDVPRPANYNAKPAFACIDDLILLSQTWDLVVVGAGVAGSSLAYSQGKVTLRTNSPAATAIQALV
jgi:hypothetical protein